MNQQELDKILELHKLWLENKKGGVKANLRGADLRGADLRGADLRGADLRGADLYNADLRGAELQYADLLGADLQYADLRGADLRGADLYNADLRGAELQYADLLGADLQCADLLGADLLGADLDFSSGIPFHCGGTRAKIDNRLAAQMIYHLTRQNIEDGKIKEWIETIPEEILNSFCKYRTDVEKM